MSHPVSRVPIAAVSFDDAQAALDRLLAVAQGRSGGAYRVAHFLLAWHDGTVGLISMADFCMLDATTREDMITILAYIAQNDVTYPKAFGRNDDLIDLWERLNGDG